MSSHLDNEMSAVEKSSVLAGIQLEMKKNKNLLLWIMEAAAI